MNGRESTRAPTGRTHVAKGIGITLAAILVLQATVFLPAPRVGADKVEVHEGTLSPGRGNTDAIWDGIHAHVFGGYNGNLQTYFDEILRFNPETGETVTLDTRLPTTYSEPSVVWTGRYAYIFGGGTGAYERKILRFDPSDGTIAEMGATLSGGPVGHSAGWNGTHAFIFGGFGGCGEFCGLIQRYDPGTDTIQTMTTSATPHEDRASAVWTGQHFYLFGGWSPSVGSTDRISRYDPAADEMVEMAARLPYRMHETSAVWDGQHAYIFGGYGCPTDPCERILLDTILRYDPQADDLVEMVPRLPSPRGQTSAIWNGTSAYIFGGRPYEGSTPSEIVRYDPRASPPEHVVAARPTNESAVEIRWSPPPANHYIPPLEGYRVYRAAEGAEDEVFLGETTTTSFTDDACPPSETCTYRVTTMDARGEGFPSDLVTSLDLTDPHRDTDDDGLTDAEEWGTHGTHPLVVDTDEDNLTDYQEVVIYHTDPLWRDSDGDALTDGNEVLVLGSDPDNPDTDGDGTPDAEDATPTRHSTPPNYFGTSESFLVFLEDGYIDVVIDATQLQLNEHAIQTVLVSGNLTAEGADGPIEHPLYFRLEAARGDNGNTWGARFALPPGVANVTREEMRVLVVDENGNAWASTQTFEHRIRGPVWAETYNATKEAAGWDNLIDHAANATLVVDEDPVAASGEGTGLDAGFPGEGGAIPNVAGSQVWAYRLEPDAGNVTLLPTGVLGGASVTIVEDGFRPVNFTPDDPRAAALFAGGVYVVRPKNIMAGFATHWRDYLHEGFNVGLEGLRSTQRFQGSFVAGPDNAWAQGNVAGDVVAGLVVWGDLRDCVRYGALTDSPEAADAVIAGLACTGLGIDLAQVFGGPVAVAGNAAVATAKTAAKLIQRGAPGFVVDLADMAKLCRQDFSLCDNLREVTTYITTHPTDAALIAKRLEVVVDVMGPENFLKLVGKNPGILARVDNLARDVAQRYDDDMARDVLARASVPSNLGTAEETLEKFTQMHKAYADHPQAAAQAGKIARDASDFLQFKGADDWVERARTNANYRDVDTTHSNGGWEGYVVEAERLRRYADEGVLVEIGKKFEDVEVNGKVLPVEADALRRNAATGKDIWTEHKKGHVRVGNKDQLETHIAAVDQAPSSANFGKIVEWRIGGTVGSKFYAEAQQLVSKYGGRVQVRLVDLEGNPITQTFLEA